MQHAAAIGLDQQQRLRMGPLCWRCAKQQRRGEDGCRDRYSKSRE
jgi:hypothetical protein